MGRVRVEFLHGFDQHRLIFLSLHSFMIITIAAKHALPGTARPASNVDDLELGPVLACLVLCFIIIF